VTIDVSIDQRFVDSVLFKALLLLGIAVVLLLIYRFAKPVIHRIVIGLLRTQQKALTEGGAPPDELAKRATTLEALLGKLVKAGVVVAIAVLILSVFDLWGVLTGVGLLAAALTLAGQSIVLDYLMGVLILVEGEYYQGDWIAVDVGNGPMDGEVTEVGLRRTVLRDANGVEHSISNGLIRVSSNLTRVYGIATVDLQIIRATDVDRALAVIREVGREMAEDPEWKARMIEGPPTTVVAALTVDGALLRSRARVTPDDRWIVANEMRRRIAVALAAAKVSTDRWDILSSSGLSSSGLGATIEPTPPPEGPQG
jgi:moderate conductance mechanosensitive channel